MTEVLSQKEIDQLLTAINAGDTEPEVFKPKARNRKPRIYDFKRPDKFSREHIRAMSILHETFARLSNTNLSAQLRAMVHIHVASVDQLTYEEFIRSIPTPTTLALINMEPLKGTTVMEIDPAVSFSILDRLFGGSGKGCKTQHELTDIEKSVMEDIFAVLLENLRKTWAKAVDLKPRLAQIDTNPQFAQAAGPTEMILLITMDTKIGDVEGMINICYPYSVIQNALDALTAAYGHDIKATTKKYYKLADWEDIPVKMIAEVFSRNYPIKEVAEWKEGQILLPLRPFTSHTCYLKLGNRRVWQCEIMEDRLNDRLNDQSNNQKGFLKQIKIIGYAENPFETEGTMEMDKDNPVMADALSMAEIKVTAELGSTVMIIKQLREVGKGTVIELDKLAGDLVDVKANGVLVAKGEVVVINDNFGVRITEISPPCSSV